MHLLNLARELEIRSVVVPPMPSLFSALGMVVADRQTALERGASLLAACPLSAERVQYD